MRCATTSTGKRLLRIQSTESREDKSGPAVRPAVTNIVIPALHNEGAQSSTARAHIQTKLHFHTYMSFSLSVPTECTWCDSVGPDEK